MNRSWHICCAVWLLIFCGATSTIQLSAADRSPYEVAWDSPCENSDGSMPLGNGEVALNAWIEPSGDLRFYIARTDSWDDNARLVKVGAVRVRVGEGSPQRMRAFRQTLNVKDATLSAQYGEADQRVELRLWVDAHRPVICVEATTARATPASAAIELWRTAQSELARVEVSDIFARRPGEKTIVEPDTLLTGLQDRVGWYHRNIKSVGPEICARLQGVADFPRPDPLLHRTFGAVIAAEHPERSSSTAEVLKSQPGTRHCFEIFVHTKHPATAEQWLAEANAGLDAARAIPRAQRRTEHEAWWRTFWQRSWIHITSNSLAQPAPSAAAAAAVPANKHPLRLGADQRNGSRFQGVFGRVGIYEAALSPAEIAQLAAQGPQQSTAEYPARVYAATPDGPTVLPQLADRAFAAGLTVEAWIKPEIRDQRSGMRIADKITVGGADGFLFDAYPGASLRLIVGSRNVSVKDVLRPGQWQHVACTADARGDVRIYVAGKDAAPAARGTATAQVVDGDDAFVVSRAYALQRFIAACAGRGQYPIKFNGSLFTVPAENGPGGPDYRRWGPGYWWQNTRLPYYSMCAAGDFEQMHPLFRMYGRDLLPLFKFRTRRHCGHDGIYIAECIYFWGDIFAETYGWQPFEERTDKLQASGWHKWEWVSGLELAGLMLDYFDHTQQEQFLRETTLPLAHEVLTFFDQHYQTGPDGKLVMHPAQSLETWWDCTNPMPELAGLYTITGRLLALPPRLTTDVQRSFWQTLRGKLPPLPTTTSKDGKTMLAPAAKFDLKRNIENPELYAVFPFRLFAFEQPHVDWALEALHQRLHRGALGWRQDDLFMTYLGQTDQAYDYVVKRARTKHAASRFPVFWGPNYDWVPDQDHGSVLLCGVQTMLLQTAGRKIFLLPAWPKGWNADFQLHAPYNTTVSGQVTDGKLVRLVVEPAERRRDVTVCGTPEDGSR